MLTKREREENCLCPSYTINSLLDKENNSCEI